MKSLLPFLFFLISLPSFTQNYISDTEKYQVNYRKKYLGKESPFTKEEKKNYAKSSYFNVQEKYHVAAKYSELDIKDTVIFATSKGTQVSYIRYAVLEFELDGITQKLYAYQNINLAQSANYDGYLFLPFKDLTNGISSYGGGRYLDFYIPDSDKTMLDFNLSYHPYCAYSYRFQCPLVPAENHLKIAIESGVSLK